MNKLAINKRTIRSLTPEETNAVAGGTTLPCIAVASSEPCVVIAITVYESFANGCF